MAAPTWLRRHLRAVVAACVAGLVVLGIAVAASWHFSSFVLVPDHSESPRQTRVEAVEPGRIVLSRDEHSSQPGVYGLSWQAGHAIAGPILGENADTVTRRLRDVSGYLAPGIEIGFDSRVYSGDPRQDQGLPFASVGVPDPLGPMPAWLVPPVRSAPGAAKRTWAIVVHGHNGDRQIGLRVVPTLRCAGYPALLISYRNDLGAPDSPDGLHHLGETEWIDLQAAVSYALDHGARRVVLLGYSMGGALIGQFMQRSPLAKRVAALVLDAPVLDWRSVLEFNAEQLGLPGFLARPVEGAIDLRIDPDWDGLDALQHRSDFHLPILLFHSTEDALVPISDSDEFAAELPRWVTYYRVPVVGHTESWNLNPALYERRLRRFLLQIGAKARRPDGP